MGRVFLLHATLTLFLPWIEPWTELCKEVIGVYCGSCEEHMIAQCDEMRVLSEFVQVVYVITTVLYRVK